MHNLPIELNDIYYDIIIALRNGCKAFVDNYGKTTYHIQINGKIMPIIEPIISSLTLHYRLIKIENNQIVLTELGKTAEIVKLEKTKPIY